MTKVYIREDRVKFRIVELEQLTSIITWVFERADQGYDIIWDGQINFCCWVLVPGHTDCIMEFLSVWGCWVSGETSSIRYSE